MSKSTFPLRPLVYSWDSGEYDSDELRDTMEFRLVYEGPLLTAGKGERRAKEKHAIRRSIHSQLKRVWQETPALNAMRETFGNQYPNPQNITGVRYAFDDLMERFRFCDTRFVPLVSEYLGLVCSLDILFLRRQNAGGGPITQRGDIDNRLKTFFDALQVPRACDGIGMPLEGEDPFYVLLEDDALITGFNVTTDRLWADVRPRDMLPSYYGLLEDAEHETVAAKAKDATANHHEENDVVLIVGVKVRATTIRNATLDIAF